MVWSESGHGKVMVWSQSRRDKVTVKPTGNGKVMVGSRSGHLHHGLVTVW